MQLITCLICQRQFKSITATHLKSHNITFKEYIERFPNAQLMSPDVLEIKAEKISAAKKQNKKPAWNKGIPKTDEEKKRLSETKKQKFRDGEITHWNSGKKTSEETKRKIRETLAKTREERGYSMSEESKEKRKLTLEEKKEQGWIHHSTKRKGVKSTLSKEELREKYFLSNPSVIARNEMRKQRKRNRVIEYIKPFNLELLAVSDDQYLYTIKCNNCNTDFERTYSVFVPSKSHLYNGEFCPTCYPPISSYYSYSLFESRPELKNEPGIFYIIELSDGNEKFLKIGITNRSVLERYRGEPITVSKILVEHPTTIFEAFELEYHILHTMTNRYTPQVNFGGVSECFDITVRDELVNKFNQHFGLFI